MLSTRARIIEREARRLLETNGVSKPGFDIAKLIRSLGISYDERLFDSGLAGAAIIIDGQKIISVNKSQSPQRKRFTAAHELGHILLHEISELKPTENNEAAVYYRSNIPNQTSEEYWQEVEANHFAAAILMPADMIANTLSTYNGVIDDTIIERLAKNFGVSQIAMSIRLGKLGYT